ncbi:hypothetical protein ACFLR2_02040 [Chlamydiota bacterium]
MRNKILVVESDASACEELDTILQKIVEEGGELIFTHKREDALALLKKECPAVVLLDHTLRGERADWVLEGVHIILTLPQGATVPNAEEHLFKPFNASQVLEKCREYLSREVVPPIPPM